MLNDIVIIGSGPAGFTAAIYAARAGRKPVLLAGSFSVGGALMETTIVENFPGFPDGVEGPELMDRMQRQAEKFGTQVIYEDVEELDLHSTPKVIKTSDNTYQAKTVIVATGSAYRHLNVPGEEELAGHGVSYCATCDGFFYKDKPIVVVGGGDSALEEATFLSRFGSSVTVVHRRDQLRASRPLQDRAFADEKISFHWNAVVERINGEKSVESVTLRDTVTGELTELEAAGVFVAIGSEPRSQVLAGQLDLTPTQHVQVHQPSTLTNIEGVFSAGDVVDDHYRQAITAAASGARAALDAEAFLAAAEAAQ